MLSANLGYNTETVIDQLNWYFLSTLPVASAYCSVFCDMFLETEYSDGTIRNKLMVGHTRKEIYCANLLTVFLANAFVYLSGCLVTVIMGVPMFGWKLADPMHLAFRIFSGILMFGAYAGITLLSIWTFDGKGELLLTIMSSLAQEESRSISENCTWGAAEAFR